MKFSDIYKPFPEQKRFHRSEAKYRLFGGAAGPGKTVALLMDCFMRAMPEGIGPRVPKFPAHFLILRRTYPQLAESIIKEFHEKIPREWYVKYDSELKTVYLANGATIRFGHAQYPKDIYNFQGDEYKDIYWDELTFFTLAEWQYMITRNRCKIPGTVSGMAAGSNPGQIGHQWVKSLFVDGEAAKGMDRPWEYKKGDYDFVPATLEGNPLYAGNSDYKRGLLSLPANLRDAMLYGRWDVFAGQYFDIFDPSKHVTEESFEFKPWWPRWISIDWGYKHPAAVHWHCATDRIIDGEPVVLTYHEFVKNRIAPYRLGEEIARQSVGQKIKRIYLSPDAFAQRSDEKPISDQLGLDRYGLPNPIAADNDRVAGWMLMWQMLASGHWLISRSCPALIRTLPALVRDDKKREDCAKMDDQAVESEKQIDESNASGDDAADSARYGLKTWFRQGREPEAQVIHRQLASIPDMTTRMFKYNQLVAKQRNPLAKRWGRTRYHWNQALRSNG
jgi:phage terminase large subunit